MKLLITILLFIPLLLVGQTTESRTIALEQKMKHLSIKGIQEIHFIQSDEDTITVEYTHTRNTSYSNAISNHDVSISLKQNPRAASSLYIRTNLNNIKTIDIRGKATVTLPKSWDRSKLQRWTNKQTVSFTYTND